MCNECLYSYHTLIDILCSLYGDLFHYSRVWKWPTSETIFFYELCITTHAILHFIDKIGTALDNHLHTVGIFFDFSKAFDTVDHRICLLNYPIMGSEVLPWSGLEAISQIRNNLFLWIRLVPVCKMSCVVYHKDPFWDHSYLYCIWMMFNTHQACCHLLFLQMILMYFFSHKNPQTLLETVNSELKNIILWIHANKLSKDKLYAF